MNSHRVRAKDMRAALQEAKDRYGDAVTILASKKVAGGIELLVTTQPEPVKKAAASDDPSQIFVNEARAKGRTLAEKMGVNLRDPGAPMKKPQPQAAANDALSAIRAEMAELKKMINPAGVTAVAPAAIQPMPVEGAMLDAGFSQRAIDALAVKTDHADPLRNGLTAVARQTKTVANALRTCDTHVFVGAAGSGKTTTLSKLVARHVLEHGPQSIAVLSLDSRRMGAGLVANSLARVLGIKVVSVSPDESLLKARQKQRAPLVLVDTAGLAPSDPGFKRQQAQIAELQGARIWLVNSTTQQINAARAVHRANQGLHLSGLILTKLDEACSLGEALSLALETGLALAWTTDGQRIPEDIQPANAAQAAHQALLLARQFGDVRSDKAMV